MVISEFCHQMTQFFILWDQAFSVVHTVDPEEKDCKKAQDLIKQAMSTARKMKMSITPKGHGMEAHVVDQMRCTPGGISMMIGHWVEKYHHIGIKYDDKCRL